MCFRAQIGMADYLLRKSQAKILNISSFKSKGKIQEKEINKLKFIEDIAKDFKIDPILQLPYGFQFDNYITKQRNESMQRESSKLEELISSIFKKLKLRNEFELAILRKHAFSTNDKENFKEKARKTILQRFLKEIAKIRKEDGKKILETADRYFENFAANKEFYLASLKDIGIYKQ